jgi:hypothetical protein
MKTFIFAITLMVLACNSTVNVPITVTETHQYRDGTCAVRVSSSGEPVWTIASPDMCDYRVGDVLTKQ